MYLYVIAFVLFVGIDQYVKHIASSYLQYVDSIPFIPNVLDFLYVENRGAAFTREQLLERIWDMAYDGGTRTVDVHVKRLRDKLPECEKHGWGITTIWRRGYKFEVK